MSINRTTVPSHCMSFTYLRYTGLSFYRYNATIQRRCYILSHNRLFTGKNCIFAINKYKGEFHLIIYFKSAVVFIVLSTAGSYCCSLLYFFIYIFYNNRILHFFFINSHFIFAINEHKGKWVIVLTN